MKEFKKKTFRQSLEYKIRLERYLSQLRELKHDVNMDKLQNKIKTIKI